MAQQKSEDCIVPEGRRKSAPTRKFEQPGGGRAVPVEGEDLGERVHHDLLHGPCRPGVHLGHGGRGDAQTKATSLQPLLCELVPRPRTDEVELQR